MPKDSAGTSSTLALSFMRKEPNRTVTTVAVFALIIFSIVSLSVIVEVQNNSLGSVAEEQGGGFDIMAEATSPMAMDLRTQASRQDAGVNLTAPADIIQLKTVGTSGAVCSNMNPQYPPRLIGADEQFIAENSFKVDSSLSGKESPEVWEELGELKDGRIPIFVDENTLIIYLGAEAYAGTLGHIFIVDGENQQRELVVAGIVSPSVIAGSFVMHEDFLEDLYPTASGYRLLFVKTESRGEVITELETALVDHGLDARTVDDIVRENTQAEQGYIGLFQAYLGAGLLIGIIALSVTEIRAVEERRKEIGMLRAVGIDRGTIGKVFYTEAGIIGILSLLMGIVGGLVLAITSAPVWGAEGGVVFPVVFLTLFAIVLMVILLLSSIIPASRASRLSPAVILKEE
jgi:putative ABC transport system permease protein